MLGAREVSVDFVEVGRLHARAGWERAKNAPEWGVFEALVLVVHEPDPGALQAIYGQVSAAQWSEYRNAYRSTLHTLNLQHETQLRAAKKRAALRAVAVIS